LEKNQLHDRYFTLDSPRDLNDATKIHEMFDFLQVKTKQPQIIFGGRKNKSIGYLPSTGNEDDLQFVLEHLPERYLRIFRDKPYTDFSWSEFLRRQPKLTDKATSAIANCRLPACRSELTC
jgi:hypothetical protein